VLKIRVVFLLCFFLLLNFNPSLRAEEGFVSPDKDTTPLHLPLKALHDLSNIFVIENLPIFVVGSGLTAVDWAFWDEPDTFAAKLDNLGIEPVFDFGNFYGEGWVEAGMALGSWSIGALDKDEKLQQFGRDCTESLALATISCWAVKVAIQRVRPDGGGLSTPSGHTITAFCVAPIINKYWGGELGIPAYVLASVTGLARVEDYRHYFSDVLMAATMGIILGNAVIYAPKDVSLSLAPGEVGLRLAFD
jgi:membrane-associated phospholipid phosphatase